MEISMILTISLSIRKKKKKKKSVEISRNIQKFLMEQSITILECTQDSETQTLIKKI